MDLDIEGSNVDYEQGFYQIQALLLQVHVLLHVGEPSQQIRVQLYNYVDIH